MVKTLELNKEELRFLRHLLDCNPCESDCCQELDTGHHPRYDCNDLDEEGKYKCPLMRAQSSLEDKIRLSK